VQKLVQPEPQPGMEAEGGGGGGGPSPPAVQRGPSPIATILQTSPSSIATTVPLALWFELAPLREAPFWREHEVARPLTAQCAAPLTTPCTPLHTPHTPLKAHEVAPALYRLTFQLPSLPL
jgi:hypothetical protein